MVSWRINSTKVSNNLKLNKMGKSNEQAETKPCTIHDVMLSLISKYWDVKTGKEQIFGSPADIYAEIIENGVKYWMRVDDGNCHNQLKDAVYHIYVSDIDGKIFEGRITSINEFKVVMKVLGFVPKN